MNKEQFRGTGKVFRFTLAQLFKSRANRISLIVMVLFSLLSVPVSLLTSTSGVTVPDTVYVDNRTFLDTAVLLSDAGEDDTLKSLSVKEGPLPSDEPDACGLTLTEEADGLLVTVSLNDSSGMNRLIALDLCSEVQETVQRALLKAMGADEASLAALKKPVRVLVTTESGLLPSMEDELPGTEEDGPYETDFNLQIGFSVLLMMCCLLSVSYVIRSVVEEKTSKLVDMLLVSVRPDALLFGKVLAVLVFVVLYMGLALGAMVISAGIAGRFADTSGAGGILSMVLSIHLRPQDFLIILVSSALGYTAFGILGGLSGAGCSSIEETGGAMSTCMLLLMAGYMVSVFSFLSNGGFMIQLLSLVPVVSMFVAPVRFLSGDIGFLTVLLSWVLQLLAIAFLIRIAANVCSSLVVYKGKRLKIGQIFSMAKKKEGAL